MSYPKATVLVFGDSNTWGYNTDATNPLVCRFEPNDRWTIQTSKLLVDDCIIIAEGLNGRTTVHHDIDGIPGDAANRNGSELLMSVLHTHKPLDVVILALGTNDLKSKFNASADDIANGVAHLVSIVKKAQNIGAFSQNGLNPPKILIMGLPSHFQTETNKLWSFKEDIREVASEASRLLFEFCERDPMLEFLSLDGIPVSQTDGIHFTLESQPMIAKAVAHKLRGMLGL